MPLISSEASLSSSIDMPAPRSDDLRDRVIALTNLGIPRATIINFPGIHLRTLERWVKLQRDFGSPYPRLYSPGRPRIVPEEVLTCLADICLHEPDIYLKELQAETIERWDILAHPTTIGRALKRAGLTDKQLAKRAKERNEEKRLAYCRTVSGFLHPEQCVYVDESAKDNRDCYRRWGWGYKGEKATKLESFKRGTKYSLVAALSFDGMLVSQAIEGSVNTISFMDFVLELMVSLRCFSCSAHRDLPDSEFAFFDQLPNMNPFPGPKLVIIMDNCEIHKNALLIEAIESAGESFSIYYIPSSSPHAHPSALESRCCSSLPAGLFT